MALIQPKTESKIERTTILVLSVINLAEDKCPKDKQGNPIPKSLLVTSEGVLGVLTSRVKNLPNAFPTEGIKCNLSFENVEYTTKSGELATASNVKQAEFQSNLRFIVENSKAVVAPEF
jgi:hypothetical protein